MYIELDPRVEELLVVIPQTPPSLSRNEWYEYLNDLLPALEENAE